ncbi:DUF3662 and FHA domain-containing protein [Corynebacterium kroppenstedtii]|uniref:DUF3662 and FHA domain-containing protein n=1 Tax=Corynebacterium sp. PCR 32 TaxID=3351342 RepID=UPI00309B3A2A
MKGSRTAKKGIPIHMDMLGRFRKLDSSLQRGMDNGFARVFGGSVIPAEIEELLKQEAEDSLVYGPHGTLYAPDRYVVYLATTDLEKLNDADPNLNFSLSDLLGRFIRNEGWHTYATTTVELKSDKGLHTGQLKCHSAVSEQRTARPAHPPTEAYSSQHVNDAAHEQAQQRSTPHNNLPHSVDYDNYQQAQAWSEVPQPTHPTTTHDPASTNTGHTSPHGPTPEQAVVTLLLQDGSSRAYHVHEGTNTIGRGNQADFRLPDTGVSRQHAELIWDGHEAVLVDLHSTNGTTVNDTPIENWLLADGDVITIGHSYIEVRINKPQG